MTIHTLRTAATAVVAAAILAGGAGFAQTTASQATPAPTPPAAPQRFEKVEPPARRVTTPNQVTSTPDPIAQLQEETTWEYSRPVFRLFQDYTLKPGDLVREVFAVLADVQIDGRVDGDVAVTLGSATLGSTAVVDGSLVVIGGSTTVNKGATVRRDLVVIGGTLDAPADFAPRGQHIVIGTPMFGDSLRALAPWLTRGLLWGRLIVPGLPWVWTIVGISFLIGLVLNHVFARQVGACADTVARRPLSTFVAGLLVLLLSGPLLMLVAASVIGLLVVPFAIAAMIAGTMLGKLGVMRAIGRGFVAEAEPELRSQAFRSYVIGAGVITVAYMVPVIGLVTWALIGVFGVGTGWMTFAAKLRRERPVPPAPVAPPAPPAPPTSFVVPEPPAAAPGAAYSSFVEPPPAASASPVFDARRDEIEPPAAPVPPFVPGPAVPAGTVRLLAYPKATFFDRAAAFALDIVLIGIAMSFFDRIMANGPAPFMFLAVAYHVAFWAWKGTTLGGVICNLRVVRTNGEDPRFVDALVRGLSGIFSVVALGIGCFWMLNDPERQTWHDKIAGTVVVKVPRELVLA